MRNERTLKITRKELTTIINEELKNVLGKRMEIPKQKKKQKKEQKHPLLEFIDQVIAEELTSSDERSRKRREKMGSGMENPIEDAYAPLKSLGSGITEDGEDEIEVEEDDELEEVNLDGQIYHAKDGTWTNPDKNSGSLTFPKGRGGQFRRSKGKNKGSSEEECGKRSRKKVCKDGTPR